MRRQLNKIKRKIDADKCIDAIYIDCIDETDLRDQISKLDVKPSKIYVLMRSNFAIEESERFKYATDQERREHMSSLGVLD